MIDNAYLPDDPTLPRQSDSALPSQPLPARAAWGRFVLRDRVGHGAFGEVYRAWDPDLEREIALKLLVPRAVTSEAEFAQVLREARALAAVRHPNVVSVYGVDRHDGRVGFWTDFVHGHTLSSLVRTHGPFGYREAALIGIDVARALSAVHRAGLLHRDIKAENVMRESGGRILLMDFGLSSLPHQHTLAGTPAYMAPELFRDQPASVTADIYAIGVLLFYLVSGEYPAVVRSLSAASAEEIARRSRSLLDLRPDLPDSFVRAVDCCLMPDPAQRFQSAGQLANALGEVLGAGAAVDQAEWPAQQRKALGPWLAAAGLLGLLVAGGGWAFHARSLHPVQPAPGSTDDGYLKAEDLLLHNYKTANLDRAVQLLEGIVRRDPSFALAEAALGRAYFLREINGGDRALLARAHEASERAIALDRTLAPPYVTLARMDVEAGRSALAMQEVHQALAADPNSAEALGAESEVFDLEGRFAEAIGAAEKAADLAPDDWHWPTLLGFYEFNAGHFEQSEASFRRAAQLTPDNPLAFANLARAQIQLNRFAEAEQNLRRSIRLSPTSDTYTALGALLTIEGKYAEAIAVDKEALRLAPEDFEHWGNLASAYALSGTGAGEATEAYSKAIRLGESARQRTPKDPELLVNLATYYAATRQPEHALPLLRQALALADNNPLVLYTAGEAYEMLGDRRKAIELVVQSQELGFGNQQLQQNPRLAALRADPAFQAALGRSTVSPTAIPVDKALGAR